MEAIFWRDPASPKYDYCKGREIELGYNMIVSFLTMHRRLLALPYQHYRQMVTWSLPLEQKPSLISLPSAFEGVRLCQPRYTLTGRQATATLPVRIESFFVLLDKIAPKSQTLT